MNRAGTIPTFTRRAIFDQYEFLPRATNRGGWINMSDLTARHLALKEEFKAARGYWSPLWDDILALDADYFEAYMQLSSVPWRNGPLLRFAYNASRRVK